MMDANTVSFNIVERIREETDSFIIETISPFCEGTMQCELSKDDIRRAFTLLLAERNGQIEERKTGKWVNDEHDIPHCSCCDYIPAYDTAIDDIYYSPYCPNCGAKMEVDDGGSDERP